MIFSRVQREIARCRGAKYEMKFQRRRALAELLPRVPVSTCLPCILDLAVSNGTWNQNGTKIEALRDVTRARECILHCDRCPEARLGKPG